MKILQSVKKIPGGLMVVPLLLGAVVNTFFGQVWTWYDGTFTTYLWKSGAMPILAVFLFCNGATIDFKPRASSSPWLRSSSVLPWVCWSATSGAPPASWA